MATKTKNDDLSALLGIPVTMGDADESVANEIKSSRGRSEGQDVVALREILRESLETGKAKFFDGVSNDKVKETLVRKVRQAGKGAAADGGDIKVATSHNRETNRLFWGPKEVIDKITKKSA